MRILRRLRVSVSLVLLMLVAASGCARFAPVPTPVPVTLRLAYREHTVELQSQAEAFHAKYPHITVQITKIQRWGNEIGTLVRGKQVDVFIESRSALDFAQQGQLLSLNEVLLDAWDSIRSDYYQGTWESLAVQGQQWGIPAGLDMYAFYLNTDVLRSLKLEVPSPNWTIEDFTELINRMNYPEGLPSSDQKVYGFCTDPTGMEPLAFV